MSGAVAAGKKRSTERGIGAAIFAGLSSYALTFILLLYLLALTWKGTLDQLDMSLYDVQNRYFNSLFFEARLFGALPLPLPGANLVLMILSVNLICGGLIRIRKKTATAGVIIGHLGILWMLSAGLVEYKFADRGYLTLYEKEEDNEFVDFHEWEIVVGELAGGDRVKEHLIPGEQFKNLASGSTATFHSDGLPFRVVVRRYYPNCRPVPLGDGGLDGFGLRRDPPEKQAEANLAGAYIDIVEDTGERQQGILWGGSPRRLPMTVRAAGKDWLLSLRHRRFGLPFTIRLDKFTKLDHPGIRMARVFSSQVTKFEDGAPQEATISMNEPLRRHGYTLFQTNWGPQGAGPGTPLFSQFEVVRSPADKWPEW
ncbi:MAG: cytochrome c biogenesis protein ResB [Planctomycetota bacterium]